jgi:uncharacterized protein (DUF427 family)
VPFHEIEVQRSTGSVRIELDGVVLASACAPVLLFETGRPTRYYLNRADVRWEHLEPSDTQTWCPFKGRTSGYWSARIKERLHPDVAWCYDAPNRKVRSIAGLIAFYSEKVDLLVDGSDEHP